MSEDNKLGQKGQEMIIEVKDIDIINRFFDYFDINMPDYLETAVSNFKKSYNAENERELRLALTKAVKQEQKKIKELDELFDPIVNACGEMSYNMQFDKDLEEALSSENSTQNQVQSSSETQEP